MSVLPTIDHWHDGAAWAGTSERTAPVRNPATGDEVAAVRLASAADTTTVVRRARDAADDWRTASLSKRTKVLFGFRQLLDERADEVAEVITRQHGKVRSDAFGEVQRGLEVVEFACGVGSLLKGSHSEQASTGVDVTSILQPVGVAVGITPFNFPAMVPLWMVPVALACGNAFVLKPSERDPGASLLLAGMLAEAGLPAGVFSVLQGDREVVDALLTDPLVDAVSFVGSTPVARHVYETATAAGKRVQALGGAKNHQVVLPDADLDAAAGAAVSAAYGSAGERCMAISVVVAVDPVGDALVERIAKLAAEVVVADGAEPGTDMGPLITAEHRDRVASMVDAGEQAGAAVVVDGRGLSVAGRPGGFFLGPSLLDHVTPDMTVYRDEIFGPVLCVVRVPSYDAAVALVRDNPYGNGVSLFTRDGGAARRFTFEVEAGMVGINVPIPVPMAYYSFGGWNDSLFGDTHVHGPEGVHFYTRSKVVTSRWDEPATAGADLGFPTNT